MLGTAGVARGESGHYRKSASMVKNAHSDNTANAAGARRAPGRPQDAASTLAGARQGP